MKMDKEIRPIRPTILDFEDSLELQEFINWAYSKEKTNSPELNKLREKMKTHVRAEEKKPSI